ncbi:MAG: ABC transporter ATP-binding protein [Kordiimonadales bacterium]|nr:MAG: ABC transporter ATP-binding protein [Kordiimonadales bacterium]
MQNQIELRKISHFFDTSDERINLFEDLSLTIKAGTTLAITGASGAGKSSLLTLAAGLETPKAGDIHIRVDGKTASATDMRAHSGFIFQHFHLMNELDALGNLALPLRLKGNKDAFDIARTWLERVGLSDRANHKPNQLSGGEQQRIAVARAFVTNPAFVFADEPTGNLDEITSGKVADLMFDFAAEGGGALVLVTHNRELANRADTSHHLAHGKLERTS